MRVTVGPSGYIYVEVGHVEMVEEALANVIDRHQQNDESAHDVNGGDAPSGVSLRRVERDSVTRAGCSRYR